jgi:hypothetical protein
VAYYTRCPFTETTYFTRVTTAGRRGSILPYDLKRGCWTQSQQTLFKRCIKDEKPPYLKYLASPPLPGLHDSISFHLSTRLHLQIENSLRRACCCTRGKKNDGVTNDEYSRTAARPIPFRLRCCFWSMDPFY